MQTILVFSDWYYPGYKAGGPIQSSYNLSVLLSRHYRVRVVTRITDLNSTAPYPGIQPDTWVELGENHEALYASPQRIKASFIRQLIKENKDSIILINGLYSFYFSILPAYYSMLLKVNRVFISVRGMLHQSALSVKPAKKRIFLSFAKGFGLYARATLLSTSPRETSEIRKILGNVSVKTAPNIPLMPRASYDESRLFRVGGKTRFLFLGRIAPEKNPVAVVDAFMQIAEPCQLTFCGSGLDRQYAAVFHEKLGKLPPHIEASYIEELPHDRIGDLLDNTDVMIMPSLGENFGHAIFESFVHAVPVIIGNNTPWTGIEEDKAGVEVDPKNTESITVAIRKFTTMHPVEYSAWRLGAFGLSKTYFEDNNFEDIYLRLFS